MRAKVVMQSLVALGVFLSVQTDAYAHDLLIACTSKKVAVSARLLGVSGTLSATDLTTGMSWNSVAIRNFKFEPNADKKSEKISGEMRRTFRNTTVKGKAVRTPITGTLSLEFMRPLKKTTMTSGKISIDDGKQIVKFDIPAGTTSTCLGFGA